MWNGELYGTLGPASCDAETISKMLSAGMTGMRLNLSHTSLAKSRPWIESLHEASRLTEKQAELLIDMQGPEIRIAHFDGEIKLIEGGTVLIRSGGSKMISAQQNMVEAVSALKGDCSDPSYTERGAATVTSIRVEEAIFSHFEMGQLLLLDDGKIELEVERIREEAATCRILRGGILTGGKSLKIVDVDIPRPALTAADLANIRLAGTCGVSALMQPFVRSGAELREVRKALIDSGNEHIRIFAKIENMEGIRNLDSILPEADMIVIARGDLGNDMPLWELPARQKEIATACKAAGKPFLVVTQMLTSMISNPVPTRAEVSDIFNAVLDGAEALMVTNETAVGNWPVEVIRYMKKTADSAAVWKKRQGKESFFI